MRCVRQQAAFLTGRPGKCARVKEGENREHQRFLSAKGSSIAQGVGQSVGALSDPAERAKKAVTGMLAAMVDVPHVTKHRPFGEPVTAGAPVSVLIGAPGTFDFGPGSVDLGPFPVPGAGNSSMAGRRVKIGDDVFRILIWRDLADA